MVSKVRQMLDRIADTPDFYGESIESVNQPNCRGDTPLHVAAIWGDRDAISLLVSAGTKVNAQGEHGFTPLHEASAQGNSEAVAELLSLGADASIRNSNGETALEVAILSGESTTVKLLEKHT